jgi:hypothetical protein
MHGWQLILLVKVADGHLPHAPRLAPFLQRSIVQLAAPTQRPFEFVSLF